MYKMMKRMRAGGGRIEDLEVMLQMANNMGIMPGTTICGLADGAAWPVKNAITKFRGEFEDYIRRHQSDAARVTALQEDIAHGVRADGDTSMPRVDGTPTFIPAGAVALRAPRPESV
jgi:NADH-quinone oxidoreductase subunit F